MPTPGSKHPRRLGAQASRGAACASPLDRADPVTGWVTFYSSCSPFDTNPYGGQIFTMRADGSGLRQLTDTRGVTAEAAGTLTVELPGPYFGVPTRGF